MSRTELSPHVEIQLTQELSRDTAVAIGELLVQVWPKPGVTVDHRADKLQLDRGAPAASAAWQSRSVLVRDGARVIAHALVFPRTVQTTDGKLTIAALASVCSDPEYRGKNLGATVARAAFGVVDEGLAPFSLFQTSQPVRAFYERLGAAVVANPIINSLGEDPQANPFWDDVVMRYPASRTDWPEGEIDLQGPGY